MTTTAPIGNGSDTGLAAFVARDASFGGNTPGLATGTAPSALDRLLGGTSPLDQLLQTPSKLDMLVARGEPPVVYDNANIRIQTLPTNARPSVSTEVEFRHLDRSSITPVRVHTITQDAPYQEATLGRGGQVTGRTRVDGEIVIRVRELAGNELGMLNTASANVPRLLNDAAARINTDNVAAYGRTTAELRGQAVDSGYYNSPSHRAWAEAAEARTGGKVPAEWWMRNDPFGGTAGNGPEIRTDGQYPRWEAKIGMAHDTDWTLGRHFGAGPLSALRTSTADATTMGAYGLVPSNGVNRNFNPLGLYTAPTGHADWQVSFNK